MKPLFPDAALRYGSYRDVELSRKRSMKGCIIWPVLIVIAITVWQFVFHRPVGW